MATPIPPRIPGDTVSKTNRLEKEYPDAVIGPYTTWKYVVVAVATTNVVTLAGLQVMDTVQLSEGDRVLLTAQTSGVANGIYVAKANAWGRANDLQLGSSASGLTVLVNEGSTPNADSVYICTNIEGADVVGVNSLVFVQLVGLGTTVSGPGSSTNTAIPTWNGTTGTKLNNSTVLLSSGGAITGATITDSSNNVAANSLKTTGASVNVAAAAPPVTTQVLTSTSATTSTWQYPSTDFLNTGTALGSVAGKVNVSDSTAPASTYVLIATSATAATWQPQSALTGVPASAVNYADFFALMPGDNAATIAQGAPVIFPQNGPTSGTTITRSGGVNSGLFNLSAIGTYKVEWQVSIDEPGQLQVGLNGGFDANTVAGRATGTSQIVGVCCITTGVINTILGIVNPPGNPAALTITPGAGSGGATAVSAHLVITQLA